MKFNKNTEGCGTISLSWQPGYRIKKLSLSPPINATPKVGEETSPLHENLSIVLKCAHFVPQHGSSHNIQNTYNHKNVQFLAQTEQQQNNQRNPFQWTWTRWSHSKWSCSKHASWHDRLSQLKRKLLKIPTKWEMSAVLSGRTPRQRCR